MYCIYACILSISILLRHQHLSFCEVAPNHAGNCLYMLKSNQADVLDFGTSDKNFHFSYEYQEFWAEVNNDCTGKLATSLQN